MTMLERVFAARLYLIGLFGAFTLFAGFHATELTFVASPDAHLPRDHPIAAVARVLKGRLVGDERLTVRLRAERESFATAAGMAKLETAKRMIATALGQPDAPDLVTELSTDGRAALIRAELPLDSALKAAGLKSALARVLTGPDGESAYRIEVSLDERAGAPEAEADARLVLCAVSALILAAGLLLYSGSFAVTGFALASAACAVVWAFGLWRLLAGNLEPANAFVPFFVFALGLVQAFALSRPLLRALASGLPSDEAARTALAAIAGPSLAALGAGAIAMASASLIPIPLVEQAAAFGALGIILVAPAALLALPLALASVSIDRPAHLSRPRGDAPFAPLSQARVEAQRRLSEVAVVLLAGFALVAGTQARERPLGPVAPASGLLRAPTLAGESSLQGAALPNRGKLIVVAETPRDGCTSFPVMDYLDRLSWRLRNLAGVTRVESLAFALKAAAARAHEDDPRWAYVPRDTPALVQAIGTLAAESRLADAACAVQPVIVHVASAHAATIDALREAVTKFATENPSEEVRLSLAGPLAEVAAANDVIRGREATVILCAALAFVLMGFAVLGHWSAAVAGALAVLLPLLGVYWGMGARGFGLGAQSLPLVIFVLVLAASLVFGPVAAASRAQRIGLTPAAAWRQALLSHGFAVGATALCLAVAFGLWVYSPNRFQAETGLLAVIAMAVAAILTLGAVPALLMLLEETVQRHTAEAFPTRAEEAARFRARMRAATGR